MMPFEYFLQNNEVKKASPDISLAKSLIKDMDDRINKALMLDIKIFSKIVFENMYDAIRDFCDALLALKGFKSYSHQASISFLSKYGFSEIFIETLDQFRYKRNSSKYYGQTILEEDAERIKNFLEANKEKLNKVKKEYNLNGN